MKKKIFRSSLSVGSGLIRKGRRKKKKTDDDARSREEQASGVRELASLLFLDKKKPTSLELLLRLSLIGSELSCCVVWCGERGDGETVSGGGSYARRWAAVAVGRGGGTPCSPP